MLKGWNRKVRITRRSGRHRSRSWPVPPRIRPVLTWAGFGLRRPACSGMGVSAMSSGCLRDRGDRNGPAPALSRIYRVNSSLERAEMMTMAWASGKSSVMVRSIWARWPGRRDVLKPRQRAARQLHGGLAARQIDHAHVAPEHAAVQAGAERLGAGLLGGEALGVGGGAVGAACRIWRARCR